MQRLRLSRKGNKHRPFYHVVAVDSRKALNGESNEQLGHYDPFTKVVHLNMDAVSAQLANGAQPTAMVKTLIKRVRKEQQAATGIVAAG